MIEFVHPGFLWALPAAAVPVLIHLLNRRRFRRIPWAAMEHLMRAQREARRRIRWQNLLLLLLRTAAVVLLVLLFAQPYPTRPVLVGPGLSVRGASVVVLLDDSASMGQRIGGTSAFERGKGFVLSTAERLAGRGAAFVVHVAGRRGPFFSASPVRPADLDRLREQLDRLQPAATVFEPAARLASLVAETEPASRGRDLHFYIVTDLRAVDWGADALKPAVRSALEVLQDYGTVCLLDVGAEPDANVGLTRLAGAGRTAYARSPSILRLTVTNDGPRAFGPGWAQVRLDGRLLPPVAVPAVPAGESRQVPLEVFLDEPGYHTLEAALPTGDAFPPDDTRFFALQAVEDVPVLIVEGAPGAVESRGTAYYLRAALRPGRGPEGGIRPELHRAGSGVRAELSDYAAVFLCNVANPEAWREPLKRYASGGGRVVIFLGSGVDAGSWNASLFDEQSGMLPCRLEERLEFGPGEAAHLSEFDFSHPLLSPFTDWETLFGRARFRGLYRVRPLGGTRVLARLDDLGASPAILASRVGEGQALLFTSSADDEWTDWPRSEAGRVTYLSLMQWLVDYGEAPSGPELNLSGDSAVEFPLDPSRFQAEAVLLPPVPLAEGQPASGGVVLRAAPGEGRAPSAAWFSSGPVQYPGVWELKLRRLDGGSRSVFFAVNVPETERLLARAHPEVLQDARVRVVQYDGPAQAGLTGLPRGPARWWPGLVAAILAVLVVESLLARVFSAGPRSDRFANPPGTLRLDRRRQP